MQQIQFGCYELLVHLGSTNEAQIFLSGIGNPATDEIDFEFVRTSSRTNPSSHRIFIKDNARSWYNNRAGWMELVRFVNEFCLNNSIGEINVFGLSMGGYGAFILAPEIGATRVVALSTRSVLSNQPHFDNRLPDLISNIVDVRFDDVLRLLKTGCRYTAIFSIDEPEDTLHAERFRGSAVSLLATQGDHNIAHALMSQGTLDDFILECQAPAPNFQRFGFFTPPERIFDVARGYLSANRNVVTEEVKKLPRRHVPRYAFPVLTEIVTLESLNSAEAATTTISEPIRPGMIVGPEDLLPYLNYGWSHSEPIGTWTSGNIHSIRMHIAAAEPFEPTEIILEFSTISVASGPVAQPVEIYLNGRLEFSRVIDERAATIRLVTTTANNEIIIITPNAIRPVDLNDGSDDRYLALLLTSLKVENIQLVRTTSSGRWLKSIRRVFGIES